MAVSQKKFAWSHSALNAFETCPRQLREVRIKKNYKDPPNPQRDFGNEVHTALEEYCRAEGEEELASEFLPYKKYGDQVLKLPGNKFYELKLALTDKFEPCPYYDRDVWLRVVIDVLIIRGKNAAALDYKTGKRKDDFDQLALNAFAIFQTYPNIEVIDTRFWWLAAKGKFSGQRYRREAMEDTLAPILPRVRRYEKAYHADHFPPKPSGLCRNHCPVASCEYHGGGR